MRKFLLVPLLVAVYLFAGGPSALAHSGKQSYVYLSFYDTEIDGRVEVPVADLGPVLGIDFGTEGDVITSNFEANRSEILAYLSSHVALESVDGEAWDLEFATGGVLDLGPRSYIVVPFEVAEDFDAAPRELVIEFDAIIEADDQKDALLHIENDLRSGVLKNESDPFLGFSSGQTVQTVALDTVPALTQLGEVRGLGTDGLRTGAVHVLFVIALMTPVALLTRGGGFTDPAPTVTGVVTRAAGALGAYAVGAAATLWLTGFGVLALSTRAVVAVTAASLLAVAGWALVAWLRPTMSARDSLVIGVLGALQGLGFGTAFVDDNLDRSRVVLSLVGFTFGVAAGVVIVASLTLLPLVLLRRTPIAPAVLVAIAAIAGAYAGAWLLEGLFDADWSIDRVANPWRVWPRNLVLALVVAAAAAGVRAWFASRDALRPIGDEATTNDGHVEREPVSVS